MDELKRVDTLLLKYRDDLLSFLPKLVFAILVLIAFFYVAKFVRQLSKRFYGKIFKKKPEVVSVIATFIYFFIMLSGVILALEILGLESLLTKLLAGAGIVGIVAGFAFKDIASNTFAGLLLSMQRPIKVGDWVQIADTFGTVYDIGMLTTSIKTIEGQEVFIPNQLIYNNRFTNFSTFKKRRVILKTGVAYGDDLEHVRKVALEEVHQIQALKKNEVVDFYFTEIGDFSYNFEVRFWINFNHQKDYLAAMNEIIMRIKKRFEQEDISIAYAVTTLDFGVKGGVNLHDKPIVIKSEET